MYPTYGLGTLIDILSMIMYILFFWTHVELLFFIFTEENFGTVNNFQLLFLFCIFDTIFNVFGTCTCTLVTGKIFFLENAQKRIGLSWNDSLSSGPMWSWILYFLKWTFETPSCDPVCNLLAISVVFCCVEPVTTTFMITVVVENHITCFFWMRWFPIVYYAIIRVICITYVFNCFCV